MKKAQLLVSRRMSLSASSSYALILFLFLNPSPFYLFLLNHLTIWSWVRKLVILEGLICVVSCVLLRVLFANCLLMHLTPWGNWQFMCITTSFTRYLTGILHVCTVNPGKLCMCVWSFCDLNYLQDHYIAIALLVLITSHISTVYQKLQQDTSKNNCLI